MVNLKYTEKKIFRDLRRVQFRRISFKPIIGLSFKHELLVSDPVFSQLTVNGVTWDVDGCKTMILCPWRGLLQEVNA